MVASRRRGVASGGCSITDLGKRYRRPLVEEVRPKMYNVDPAKISQRNRYIARLFSFFSSSVLCIHPKDGEVVNGIRLC